MLEDWDWEGRITLACGGDLEPGRAVGAGLEKQFHNVRRTGTSCGLYLGKPGVHFLGNTEADTHVHKHPFYEK